MIRRPPRSTLSSSSAASDVYKRQVLQGGVAAALGSSQLGTHVSDDLRILTSLSVTTQGSTSQSCTSSSTQGLSTSVSCTATTAIQTTHTVFSLSTGAVAMTLRGLSLIHI
eukprot:TRINITY_DN22131_c0_g1_i2.p2 TRINITY_DN22131_c0_g1~~TRINITY_DN22131_c0_g1_i2.p2  ORF type:complete len:111 (+),score=25.44 TRINITY_DN22131_c0_g1_i2:148-480(+)